MHAPQKHSEGDTNNYLIINLNTMQLRDWGGFNIQTACVFYSLITYYLCDSLCQKLENIFHNLLKGVEQ